MRRWSPSRSMPKARRLRRATSPSAARPRVRPPPPDRRSADRRSRIADQWRRPTVAARRARRPAVDRWRLRDAAGLLREAARTAVRELRPKRASPRACPTTPAGSFCTKTAVMAGGAWPGRPAACALSVVAARAPAGSAGPRPRRWSRMRRSSRSHGAVGRGPDRRHRHRPSAVAATREAVAAAGLADVVQAVERDLFLRDETGLLAASATTSSSSTAATAPLIPAVATNTSSRSRAC